MPNVQQPEMRRSEENPLVQDSKRPDDTDRPAAGGRGNRPVPADDDSDAAEQPR
jgi:hypothetical protein